MTGFSRLQVEDPDDPLFVNRHREGGGMTAREREIADAGLRALQEATEHEDTSLTVVQLAHSSPLGNAMRRMIVRRIRDLDCPGAMNVATGQVGR